MAGPIDLAGVELPELIEHEWLVSNGLGGYASGTVCGLNTRKYHGLLVAAMSPPVRRMVLLSRIEETLFVRGKLHALSCAEYPGTINPCGYSLLQKFSADPHPRWAWQGDGWTLTRWLRLMPGRNAVVLSYCLLGCEQSAELLIRPMLALRSIHELSYQWNGKLSASRMGKKRMWRVSATCRTPEVFMSADTDFDAQPMWYLSHIYRREIERGYPGLEDLWTPGQFAWTLRPGQFVHFVCATDPISVPEALAEIETREPFARRASIDPVERSAEVLRRSLSVFLPSPAARGPDAAVPVTSLPWAPPRVREALMAYRGLFLATDRVESGRAFLRWCAEHIEDGLIPTSLDETGGRASYDAADTSLWFVQACYEHLQLRPDDEPFVRDVLYPAVVRIIEQYSAGTTLGIRVDPDGLLRSAAPGMPTSWMNAKIGDWVVTPRQGKPIELQALWYNATRIAAEWCARFGDPVRAAVLDAAALQTRDTFNARFWHASVGCCFDVLTDHGADPSVRPNQLLAITLAFPVLDRSRWEPVIDTVGARLLVSGAVRTLVREDPGYRGTYGGDICHRDRALHQGVAHPWLVVELARAAVRSADRAPAALRHVLEWIEPIVHRIDGEGLNLLAEVRDAEPPHRWGGAIAAALAPAMALALLRYDLHPAPALPVPPIPAAPSSPAGALPASV